jgi:hypothetical protein
MYRTVHLSRQLAKRNKRYAFLAADFLTHQRDFAGFSIVNVSTGTRAGGISMGGVLSRFFDAAHGPFLDAARLGRRFPLVRVTPRFSKGFGREETAPTNIAYMFRFSAADPTRQGSASARKPR